MLSFATRGLRYFTYRKPFLSLLTSVSENKLLKVVSRRSKNSYCIWRHFLTSASMACCGNSCGPDLSKEALKQRLTAQQYQVTQEKDTERPFSGKYCKHFEKGTYTCIVCNQDLFTSDAKYDSKCGWPAFFDCINDSVSFKNDLSHVSCNLLLLTMKTDMKRKEVLCSKCGAHLGHVFDDGPKPTGKRYCVNSASLDFRKQEEEPTSS